MDTRKSSLTELRITATHFLISRFPCQFSQFLPLLFGPSFCPKGRDHFDVAVLAAPIKQCRSGPQTSIQDGCNSPVCRVLLRDNRLTSYLIICVADFSQVLNSHHCQASLPQSASLQKRTQQTRMSAGFNLHYIHLQVVIQLQSNQSR